MVSLMKWSSNLTDKHENVWNADLRLEIVDLVRRAGEGHIPSSFSIVDLISTAYQELLTLRKEDPHWPDRDRFVLSKGHGAAALFVVLVREGLLDPEELQLYGTLGGKLGGHPDSKTTPFVESSTGSLGHGFPGGVGMALGLRIRKSTARVVALLGDGECQEGTIWEAANVAANRHLNNLLAIVDWNKSAAQLMPIDSLPRKWRAFGWETLVIDGHDRTQIIAAFNHFTARDDLRPMVIVARTVKGKGVALVEGHGKWHHRIPDDYEYQQIRDTLRGDIKWRP